MKEMIDYYSEEGELVGNIEKKHMHEQMRKEFLNSGKITVRHKHVRLLLMTSKWKNNPQRRSKWKGDNPGLWDKTIGGHVTSGESYDLTMLKECAEELGIPATTVRLDQFEHSLSVTDLHILGILTPVLTLDNYKSTRNHNGKKWVEPGMTQFYIGYYDGPIRFIDSESCGIQVFNAEELDEELKKYPESFTEDMHYMMKRFRKYMKPSPKRKFKVNND